ncbi:hypothetical protein LCGC14_2964970 [marine sediment metagenome]|uniref:Uncharacterized protein n=1 Tax=marine sediment metagenome TaxID=412755 RepID=A0A0F8XB59_9ZZZZ
MPSPHNIDDTGDVKISAYLKAAHNAIRRGEREVLQTTFTTHPNPRSTAIYLYNYDPDNPVYYDGLEPEEVR